MKSVIYNALFIISIFLFSFQNYAQTQQVFDTPGQYTWEAPSCVSEITVSVWGSGGGGGGALGILRNSTGDEVCSGAGGGGGGGYTQHTFAVTPGQSYTLTVGAGGNSGAAGSGSWNGGISTPASSGGTGGTSAFTGSGVSLIATGGSGGSGASGYNQSSNGNTCTATDGAGSFGGIGSGGSINFSGGNGLGGKILHNSTDKSGPGGGAAGPGGNGGTPTHTSAIADTPGGIGQAAGGNGADGRMNNKPGRYSLNGRNGFGYGGGASGAMVHRDGSYGLQQATGGTGANGAVIINYSSENIPNEPTVNVVPASCVANGSATISDYNSSYTYSFSPSGPTIGVGGVINNFTPGQSYTVTVSQVEGCFSSETSFTILPKLEEPLAPEIQTSPATCDNDGTISITNYESGVTYTFSPAGPVVLPNGTITNASPNVTYSIHASNGSCSSATVQASVEEQLPLPSPPNLDMSAGNCTNDGYGTITNFNSNATYTITPSTATIVDAAGHIVGTPGTYTITVTVDGCPSEEITFVIESMLEAPTVAQIDQGNPTCFSNGNVIVVNYNSNYSYTFDPAGPSVIPNGHIIDMDVNTAYTLTVSNGVCDSPEILLNIGEQLPSPSQPEVSVIAASCSADGTATIDNYDPTLTYDFTPSGITITSNGSIQGAVAGTNYTVIVENGDGCTATESFTISAQLPTPETPTVTIDNADCSSDGSVVLTNYDLTNTYTFSPSGPTLGVGAGSTRNINNVSPNTSYVLTVSNGDCTSQTSFMIDGQLQAPNAPEVTINAPDCNQDGSAYIENYNAAFTYVFSNPNVSVGANGVISGATMNTSYTVTVNDGDCSSTTTVFTISGQLDTPVISLSASPSEICAGESTILVADGGASYAWNDGLGTGSNHEVSPEITTTYTVTGTGSNGCEMEVDVVILVNSLPVLEMDQTDVACNGGNTGSATVSAQGSGGYSYSWSPTGGNNATASGLSPGTYTVTVVDGNQCESTASVSITEPTEMNITTGSLSSNCSDNTGSASVTATGGTLPYSYQWGSNANNQTTATATNLSAGTYTITVTDGNGCSKTTFVNIDNPDAPIVTDVSLMNVNCEGGNDGAISVTATGGTGSYTYFWSPNGETTSSLEDLEAGTYILTITDEADCLKDTVITIGFNNSTPEITIDALTQEMCEGGTIELTSEVTNGGDDPAFYWEGPNGYVSPDQNPIISDVSVSANGTYTLFVTGDGLCASESASIEVIVNPTPGAPTVEATQEFCGEATIADLSAIGNNIAWYDSEFGGDLMDGSTPIYDGDVYYVLQSENGCESELIAVNVVIYELPNAGTISGTDSMCEGDSISLESDGDSNGVWSSSNSDIAQVDVNGNVTNGSETGEVTIYYTVDAEGNCGSEVAEHTITIFENPELIASVSNDILCEGESFVLSSNVENAENYSWTSTNGYTSSLANPGIENASSEHNGTYYITVISEDGCAAQDSVEVLVNSLPEVGEILTAEENICKGMDVVLSFDGLNDEYTYIWTFEDEVVGNGMSHSIDNVTSHNVGTYSIYAQTEEGCMAFAGQFELTGDDCEEIIIFESFSPNGDEINDYFYIENLALYPNTEVWIYNRWGTLVFHSNDYLNDWDGTSQSEFNVGGNELPEGTYYYLVKLGGEMVKSGEIYKGYVYIKR